MSPGHPKVAITGGGGHLGRGLVRLLLASGSEVVLLRRGGEQADQWTRLCMDIDAVVHLAAPTEGVDDVLAESALSLTRRLFAALPDRPVSFVFAGTMALFRPAADEGEIDERSPVFGGAELARQDGYTRMKAEQEHIVRTACTGRGDRLTILRPSNVWNEERWLQSCIGPKAGPLWFVVQPHRRLRLIHATNCMRAFVAAVRDPAATIEELNVDDGPVVSAWRYATRVIDWRRHGYLPIPVPGWMFDAMTSMGRFVLRAAAPRRRLPGLLIAERRAARFGSFGIDTRRVRERLGWRPDLGPYKIAAGLP